MREKGTRAMLGNHVQLLIEKEISAALDRYRAKVRQYRETSAEFDLTDMLPLAQKEGCRCIDGCRESSLKYGDGEALPDVLYFAVERLLRRLGAALVEYPKANDRVRAGVIQELDKTLMEKVQRDIRAAQVGHEDDDIENEAWEGVASFTEDDELKGRYSSSSWTGRPTLTSQVRAVRVLAPSALAAVAELIERVEHPLHNGGPEPVRLAEALAELRALHVELGRLIELAEAGAPVDAALGHLKLARRVLFQWSADTYNLTVAGLPLTTSTTAIACGVMALLHLITKGAVGLPESAAIGTAVAGVHGAAAIARAPKAPD
jgi:hypothetical protein